MLPLLFPQVHKAFLKNEKTWVAIKVRKPNIQTTFDIDFSVIRGLVNLLRWLSIKPYMRWQDMLWEIEQVMREELDYHYEANKFTEDEKITSQTRNLRSKTFPGIQYQPSSNHGICSRCTDVRLFKSRAHRSESL